METISMTDLMAKIENGNMYKLSDELLSQITNKIADNLDWIIEAGRIDEIGYLITETENYNGSWYCSTFLAKQDVLNNWDTFADLCSEYEDTYGIKLDLNPFDEIEKLHAILMIFIADKMANDFSSEYLQDVENWFIETVTIENDTLKITYEE